MADQATGEADHAADELSEARSRLFRRVVAYVAVVLLALTAFLATDFAGAS